MPQAQSQCVGCFAFLARRCPVQSGGPGTCAGMGTIAVRSSLIPLLRPGLARGREHQLVLQLESETQSQN